MSHEEQLKKEFKKEFHNIDCDGVDFCDNPISDEMTDFWLSKLREREEQIVKEIEGMRKKIVEKSNHVRVESQGIEICHQCSAEGGFNAALYDILSMLLGDEKVSEVDAIIADCKALEDTLSSITKIKE